MTEHDERYGAWRDNSGGVHYILDDTGDAHAADKTDKTDKAAGQGSAGIHEPVGPNDADYPSCSSSSTLTGEDYKQMARQFTDIARRPVDLALELEKEGWASVREYDPHGAAEAFTTLYDILSAPNWNDYYKAAYERFPGLEPHVWDSLSADRKVFGTQAAAAWFRCAIQNADNGNYDAAVQCATNAVVFSGDDTREAFLDGLGNYLYYRGKADDENGLHEQAVADYKRAAHCSKEWAESALDKLAEKGIRYTPGPVLVTERKTPPAIVEMIGMALAKMKSASSATKSKKAVSTAAPAADDAPVRKRGVIATGIILGLVCGLLIVFGLDRLAIIVTGDPGRAVAPHYLLIGAAVITVLVTILWYRRKWSWIVLLFLLALLGLYGLVGAPGLTWKVTLN